MSRGARAAAALLLAALLCPAGPAAARGLWGRSSSTLLGYAQPGAGGQLATYLPLFQLMELRASDLGLQGLAVNASFWGVVDLLDPREGSQVSGDLTSLFIRYRPPEEGKLAFLRGLELTAGRQLVAFGPTVLEQVDGGKLRYVHASGLELGLFGGAPTGTRFSHQPWPLEDDSYAYNAHWLVGARLGYVDLGLLSGGASYVHRRYGGEVADSDLGLDLSVSPHRVVDLATAATLGVESLRLKAARGTVALRPLRAVSLAAGYRYSSPDLFIPRTSIFAVFSEESFHEAYLEARWRATRSFSLDGAYGRRFFKAAGAGDQELRGANRASLRALLRFWSGGRGCLELARVESPDNAANRLRLAGAAPLQLWGRTYRVVLDLDITLLDKPLRSVRYSALAGAYLSAPLRPGLELMAGGSGGFTPLMDEVGTFNLRLTWAFDAFTAGGVQVRRGAGS